MLSLLFEHAYLIHLVLIILTIATCIQLFRQKMLLGILQYTLLLILSLIGIISRFYFYGVILHYTFYAYQSYVAILVHIIILIRYDTFLFALVLIIVLILIILILVSHILLVLIIQYQTLLVELVEVSLLIMLYR